MTFCITAHCSESGRTGIAVAGSAPTVGNRCVFVAPQGAIAMLAMSDPAHAQHALSQLARPGMPESVLRELLDNIGHTGQRQVAVVGASGDTAVFTGGENIAWAGHRRGAGYVAMGNYLAGPDVVRAMGETFEDHAGQPLEWRLLAALEAGRDAGGQTQGQVSAALRSQSPNEPWSPWDLRVDVHEEPVGELRRIAEWNAPFVDYYARRVNEPHLPRLGEYLRERGLQRSFGRPVVPTWRSRRP